MSPQEHARIAGIATRCEQIADDSLTPETRAALELIATDIRKFLSECDTEPGGPASEAPDPPSMKWPSEFPTDFEGDLT